MVTVQRRNQKRLDLGQESSRGRCQDTCPGWAEEEDANQELSPKNCQDLGVTGWRMRRGGR